MNIAIVVSRFNELVTQSLLNGAVEAFYERGGDPEDLEIIEVPGAFELPFVVGRLAEEGEWDGIVVLGCILQGETDHHQHLASSVFHALAELNTWGEIPITQGILTAHMELMLMFLLVWQKNMLTQKRNSEYPQIR